MPAPLTQQQIDSMVGQRFGRLIVSSLYRSDDKYLTWRAICVCDCGGTIDTMRSSLRSGKTSSCHCFGNYISEYSAFSLAFLSVLIYY